MREGSEVTWVVGCLKVVNSYSSSVCFKMSYLFLSVMIQPSSNAMLLIVLCRAMLCRAVLCCCSLSIVPAGIVKAREWAVLLSVLAKQGITPPPAWQRATHAVMLVRVCVPRQAGGGSCGSVSLLLAAVTAVCCCCLLLFALLFGCWFLGDPSPLLLLFSSPALCSLPPPPQHTHPAYLSLHPHSPLPSNFRLVCAS